MEPKQVLFDAIVFRPNHAIESFYYNPSTFKRVNANREFYEGDIVHITETAGNESDPGGMVWECQFRNSEDILGRVWIQPMASDWARKDGQAVKQVVAPDEDDAPALDPALYTGWLFVTRPEGVEVWPEDGKGSGYITIVPFGYVFKHIQQPNFYEVEWQGHSAFIEPKYIAPALEMGHYYQQLARLKWVAMQDPEYKPPEPPPVHVPWYEKLAQWLYDHNLRWLGDLIVWIFNR